MVGCECAKSLLFVSTIAATSIVKMAMPIPTPILCRSEMPCLLFVILRRHGTMIWS
ncbi:hypothetical protein HanRHA438_Chr16g0742321 [Helianthus annuus]|nr:hypothetical protein HanRHA438_Chr16g0742321 [Helianthus annuus]